MRLFIISKIFKNYLHIPEILDGSNIENGTLDIDFALVLLRFFVTYGGNKG